MSFERAGGAVPRRRGRRAQTTSERPGATEFLAGFAFRRGRSRENAESATMPRLRGAIPLPRNERQTIRSLIPALYCIVFADRAFCTYEGTTRIPVVAWHGTKQEPDRPVIRLLDKTAPAGPVRERRRRSIVQARRHINATTRLNGVPCFLFAARLP